MQLGKRCCKHYLFLKIIVLVVVNFVVTATYATETVEELHRVPRVNSEIRVDGVLNESIWEQALSMELAYEVRPGENIPPPVKTEVLLAYGESHLFAAFRAYDPDPNLIRARITDRDDMWSDDWVALNFDTFNDQRRSYLFVCNPFGIQADNVETTGGGGGTWDAIWDSKGIITAEGYQVEIAIPFSSMRFQRSEDDQVWGFDAIRSYPRNVRHHIGLFARDRNNNCYLCQAEKIIGFAGATPGRNIEFDPTVSGLVTEERVDGTRGRFVEESREEDLGLTARWGLTPNLTFNVTVNPDFSQVEADAAQLDVNRRFALWYRERRPFFLEGSELFDTRFNAVHTRTLADPTWGMKLTGKEGANAIGYFTVRDEVTTIMIPGTEGSNTTSLDYMSTGSVLRYRRDILGSSTIGILATDRESEGYHNRVGGIDADLRVAKTERISFQVLDSRTQYPVESIREAMDDDEYELPDEEFEGQAYRFRYSHGTNNLDWYLIYRDVTPNFRADLGFIPQVGYRFADGGWGHTWHNDSDHWWNMLNIGSGYEIKQDHYGNYLSKAATFWGDYGGPSESYMDYYGEIGSEHYDGKEYPANWIWLWGGFRPWADVWCSMSATIGDEIDYDNSREADVVRLSPHLGLKLGRHLSIDIDHEVEWLNVKPGNLYVGNISQTWIVYQFTRRMFLRTIFQYVDYRFNIDNYDDPEDMDSKYQGLFSQVLFSYKVNPQTVLYLGYSDNWDGDQEIPITQTNRTVFMKLGYAWVL